MDIQPDTHPWTAYARKEQQQHILETFRSRREAIAWIDAHQDIHPIKDNGFYIHDSIIIQRTDINPILHTPYDVIIVHGYEVLHTTNTSTNNIHRNTDTLDTIIQPIIRTVKLRMYPRERTGKLAIEWHHPLPDIFPFHLLLRRTYTQIITPSTITLTANPKIGIKINWIKTISNGKIWDNSQIDDNRQHILDILDHTLTRSNTISQHNRMQYMRQLSRIIDPDICNIIGTHYTLD